MEPTGTIVFSTVGRPHFGFDVFSVDLHSQPFSGRRLTDGVSVNFNASFSPSSSSIAFVSERSGSPKLYSLPTRPDSPNPTPTPLPSAAGSLFHDRPVLRHTRLFFISAHQPADSPFKSWSAINTADEHGDVTRLTPESAVDYSPAVSQSGNIAAVASYGSKPWAGDFHELQTEIAVFPISDPDKRVVVADRGGWPTFSGESTLFFHRIADDGWWSIYEVEISDQDKSDFGPPRRVTPAGVHAFTPAAFPDGKRIAVATRRKGNPYRHVEIFNLETEQFQPVTETLNPNFHHCNPSVSPNSEFLAYHRFRGESEPNSDQTIPNLEPVTSPISGLQLLRINGSFPWFSPEGDLIAYNHTLANGGLTVMKSDGSKRRNIFTGRTAFYNSWSPVENNVIFTSIGPIFQKPRTSVQIARVTFDLTSGDVDLKTLTKEESGNNAFPACSPDGKSVVFRSGRSGHKNLYIIDAVSGEFAGGGIFRLTEGEWIDTMPCWSPDGETIAFSSNRHRPENDAVFSIYLVRKDGTGVRRVHVAGGGDVDRERNNHVCFSADGEWLLFTSNLGGVTAEPVATPNQFQPYGELYAARVDGSGVRRLTWNGYENGTPAWHPKTLRLNGEECGDCDKLTGEFDEPMWITTDF